MRKGTLHCNAHKMSAFITLSQCSSFLAPNIIYMEAKLGLLKQVTPEE